jgi:hypothetical protein
MFQENVATYASKSLEWPVEANVGIRIVSEYGSDNLDHNRTIPDSSLSHPDKTEKVLANIKTSS